MIQACHHLGLNDRAVRFYLEIQKRNPSTSGPLVETMILVYGKLGRVAAMQHLYHRATKQFLSSAQIQSLSTHLAQCYALAGEQEKADQLFARLRKVVQPSLSE